MLVGRKIAGVNGRQIALGVVPAHSGKGLIDFNGQRVTMQPFWSGADKRGTVTDVQVYPSIRRQPLMGCVPTLRHWCADLLVATLGSGPRVPSDR